MTTVIQPFPFFADLGGDPLDEGYIYIGLPNQNPETSPKQAYWDEALTIPATQPLRTLEGYIARNGAPARAFVNGSFSMTVRNKRGSLVYTLPEVNSFVTFADLALPGAAATVGAVGVADVQDAIDALLNVADYAALRLALRNTAAKRIYVTGYLVSATPSGIAGTFTRGGGPAPSDDGGVIIVDSTSGEWAQRIYEDEIHVEWWPISGVNITSALQSACTLQAALQVSTQDGKLAYLGNAPDVVLPAGRWELAATVNWSTFYGRIVGKDTILAKAASFSGTVGIRNVDGAWRVSVHRVQFEDFHTGIECDNRNDNSGLLEFVKCGFFNNTYGARLRCQSSRVVFQDCIWRGCEHEIWQENVDYVEVRGGWISGGTFTSNGDGGIVIDSGSLDMFGTTLVPAASQTATECAWIRNNANGRMVRLYSVRFGGEPGAYAAVNNYASWDQLTAGHKNGIEFINCENNHANTQGRCAVRLFRIPNIINFIGSNGLENNTYIAWSSTISSGTQATLIADITPTDQIRKNAQITLLGNSSYYIDPAFGLPLYPANLGFLLTDEVRTFTPTITSASGSLSSVSGASAKMVRRDQRVTVDVDFTVANNGTGANALLISGLPYEPVGLYAGSGANVTDGVSLYAQTNLSNQIVVWRYDNAYPGVTGRRYLVHISYDRI